MHLLSKISALALAASIAVFSDGANAQTQYNKGSLSRQYHIGNMLEREIGNNMDAPNANSHQNRFQRQHKDQNRRGNRRSNESETTEDDRTASQEELSDNQGHNNGRRDSKSNRFQQRGRYANQSAADSSGGLND